MLSDFSTLNNALHIFQTKIWDAAIMKATGVQKGMDWDGKTKNNVYISVTELCGRISVTLANPAKKLLLVFVSSDKNMMNEGPINTHPFSVSIAGGTLKGLTEMVCLAAAPNSTRDIRQGRLQKGNADEVFTTFLG